MDLSKSTDRTKLFKAIDFHYGKLKGARDTRKMLVKNCAGDLFSRDGFKTMLGLSRQALEVHVVSLAANLPRVLITAKRPQYAGFASHYTRAMNKYIKSIHLDWVFIQNAYDSFFGPAYAKVYLKDSLFEVYDGDEWVDPGMGFVERKSLDNLVYDTEATEWRNKSFIADRYRLPLRVLKEDRSRFPRSAYEALKPTYRDDQEQTSDIATTKANEAEEGRYEEMIDLVDVYLPRDNRTYTFATDSRFQLRNTPPLQMIDWEGGEEGPIKMLNLGTVPDHVQPSAPANYLYWLDMAINQSQRKLARQAERMKVLGLVDGKGDGKTYESIRDANDGEVIEGSPMDIQEFRIGGPDNQLHGWMESMLGKFDRMGGNISLRAGLGAATGTATQDQILTQQANRLEASQQQTFQKFVVSVLEEVGRFLYTDPATELDTEMEVGSLKIPTTWQRYGEEGSRQGEWDDYEYCIEPNSMPYRSQGQRAQELRQLNNELLQVIPIMMQLGADVAKYIDELAELHDLPRLREIYAQLLQAAAEQQAQQQQGPSGMMGEKPNGEYTRRNVSEGGNEQNNLVQQLMGAGSPQQNGNGEAA